MQTFLPYPSFQKSAKVLDYRRLGKQRVETFQILNVLLAIKQNPDANIAWRNHPAVLMWEGHESALCMYGIVMCKEWEARGYTDNMRVRFLEIMNTQLKKELVQLPEWFGKPIFHTSHRSNLLRKEWRHYRKYWPKLSNKLPYYWPKTKNANVHYL